MTERFANRRPLGSDHYENRLAKRTILCEVPVFLLRVEHQRDDQPKKNEKEAP